VYKLSRLYLLTVPYHSDRVAVEVNMQDAETRLPVTSGVRDELRALKIGGQTYDEMLKCLIELARRHRDELTEIAATQPV